MLWRLTRALLFIAVVGLGSGAAVSGNTRLALAAGCMALALLLFAVGGAVRAHRRLGGRRGLDELHRDKKDRTPYR